MSPEELRAMVGRIPEPGPTSGPGALREPGVMAKVCGRILCGRKPVTDRWVKVPGLAVGGYWEPLCARHRDEFDAERSAVPQPRDGEVGGG